MGNIPWNLLLTGPDVKLGLFIPNTSKSYEGRVSRVLECQLRSTVEDFCHSVYFLCVLRALQIFYTTTDQRYGKLGQNDGLTFEPAFGTSADHHRALNQA